MPFMFIARFLGSSRSGDKPPASALPPSLPPSPPYDPANEEQGYPPVVEALPPPVAKVDKAKRDVAAIPVGSAWLGSFMPSTGRPVF